MYICTYVHIRMYVYLYVKFICNIEHFREDAVVVVLNSTSSTKLKYNFNDIID